jgi:hypothetical protein
LMINGPLAYHLREGGHALTTFDWKLYIDHADTLFKRKSLTTSLLQSSTAIDPNKLVSDSVWSRFHGNRQATGRSDVIGAQSDHVRWKLRLSTWSGSPAIGFHGIVYTVGEQLISPSPMARWHGVMHPQPAR